MKPAFNSMKQGGSGGARKMKAAKNFNGSMRGNTEVSKGAPSVGAKHAHNTVGNGFKSMPNFPMQMKQATQTSPLGGKLSGYNSNKTYPNTFDTSKFGPTESGPSPKGPVKKKFSRTPRM